MQKQSWREFVWSVSLSHISDEVYHGWIQRWGQGVRPLKNHKNIGFHSNTGPDPLKNHKVTIQCWAIIGPPAKSHVNGVFIVIFGLSIPSLTKKEIVKFILPLTKLSGSEHVYQHYKRQVYTLYQFHLHSLDLEQHLCHLIFVLIFRKLNEIF